MELFDLLYKSIIPDSKAHPERTNATFERIQEVTNLVLDDSAPVIQSILTIAGHLNKHPRAPINDEMARLIVETLLKKSRRNQIYQIVQLLEDSELSAAEAIDLHEQFKIPVSHLEKDIIPVWGKDAWLRAIDGKSYLDMDSNYSATNLGLNNMEIARGLYNQATRLISVKEDRVHVARARFLKTFPKIMPEGLNQFYWQNSGGEAVDKSLKFAKAFTQMTGVVAFRDSFHGRTHGAVAVTYNPKYRKPFGLEKVDWVHFVNFNDADAVEKLFAEGKARTVILELIQSEEAGIHPADPVFVSRLRQICDQYNGVMICDEVQTGFGRCAEQEDQWFACQVYDVVPDIMAIGKSFGGGYPVTAVVAQKKIAKAIKPGYDGSTFGGNPMAMVAATIATQKMASLKLTKNVVSRSSQLFDGLYRLQKKYPALGEIRGKGLMIGFDLPSKDYVNQFQQEMAKNGVGTSLSTDRTVRILPPLIISKSDVDFFLDAMHKTFEMIGIEEEIEIKNKIEVGTRG
jgi:acetylornithine/succinyldiaminopimelate/putrescine aminotransferase